MLYFVCQLYIFATVRLQNYFWGEVEEEEEGKWGCWSQFRGDNTVLETQFIFVILPCILQERRRRRSKKGWCDVPLPKCHSALESEKNIAIIGSLSICQFDIKNCFYNLLIVVALLTRHYWCLALFVFLTNYTFLMILEHCGPVWSRKAVRLAIKSKVSRRKILICNLDKLSVHQNSIE